MFAVQKDPIVRKHIYEELVSMAQKETIQVIAETMQYHIDSKH